MVVNKLQDSSMLWIAEFGVTKSVPLLTLESILFIFKSSFLFLSVGAIGMLSNGGNTSPSGPLYIYNKYRIKLLHSKMIMEANSM